VGVREFWELTPAETMRVLKAWAWREERAQERLAWQVWHIAGLQRTKLLPPLKRLLQRKSKPLTEAEVAEKRQEHAEMVRRWQKSRPHPPAPSPGRPGEAESDNA